MSKDFEKAYRELAESEIPDLWDRIEAGLESKSTPEIAEDGRAETEGEAIEEVEEETIRETIQEVSPKTDVKEKRYGKRKWARFAKYSGIAAAAVCVAVIIPAAVFLFRSGLTKGYSGGAAVTEGIDTAASADEAMEFASDEAIGVAADEEESCETASEEMDTGAGALDEEVGELAEDKEETGQAWPQDNAQSTVQDSGGDKAMAEMEDVSQMRDAADELKKESQSSVKQESAPQEAETEGNSAFAEAAIEGTVFEHVEIKVTEAQNDFDREDGSLPGTLYTATVQKDASGKLKEGEELVVDVPAHSSYALVKDGVFEVDLVYKGNGTYGLKECYRQVEE